jgi:hypothetical protein
MAGELRRCGMCKQMKADGISSADGELFICDGCNDDATKFREIAGSLYTPHQGSEED